MEKPPVQMPLYTDTQQPAAQTLLDTDSQQPTVQTFFYRDPHQSSALLLQLNNLRQEQMFTDVLLCSGDTHVACHKNVLVSSSAYFRAMFCSGFLEQQQSKVVLKNISASVLNVIVDYVYTGAVCIDMDNVLPLMQAAAMLQYNRLFEACSSFLQMQLSPDNCLSMLRLSEILNCESLQLRARDVAMRSFSDVCVSEDLNEMSLPELLRYLEDDQLCAGEEQVFETLVAWIHHDPPSRSGAISDLFRKVRLRHIHPTYLFQFIANDPLIQSSTLCTELIECVRRLMFSVNSGHIHHTEFKNLWVAPRRFTCQDRLVVVGGRKNGEQTSREALVFEEATQTWSTLAKLPIRLYRASYVTLHSVLYVIGGLTTSARYSQVTSTVYTLSLKTNQWRLTEPLSTPRFAHQSLSYQHFIFVLGGLGADRRLTPSVERFNSMFNQWETVAPMPEAVLHPAVAAVGPRIYVFGGEDALQNPVRLIQVYHVARNMWSKMENRTVKNVSAPAAVIDDKIYIIGGYTRRTIAYDTTSNSFLKCANLKERRMHHSAAVLHNTLFITGGRCVDSRDVIKDCDTVEVYDPQTDSWSCRGALPHQLFHHGSITLSSLQRT